jgi:AraC-like DNA-binding protein
MSGALAVFHGRFGRASICDFNRPFNLHAHREGHLIFYVRGAPACVEVAGRDYRLDEDEVIAISPWEPHRFLPSYGEGGSILLVLYVNGEWFAPDMERDRGLRFGRTAFGRTPAIDLLIRQTLSVFADGSSLPSLDSELRRLIQACHEESWRSLTKAGPNGSNWAVSDFRVRKSIRLMSERPCAELDLDGVARNSGLSRPHFYKLFREQTGVTPHLYLKTLLMEKALDRLVESCSPIADIGFDLGFSSQSGFTRFFASNVGVPPTDYRRAAHVLQS